MSKLLADLLRGLRDWVLALMKSLNRWSWTPSELLV